MPEVQLGVRFAPLVSPFGMAPPWQYTLLHWVRVLLLQDGAAAFARAIEPQVISARRNVLLWLPEFGNAGRALGLMELTENKDWLREMFSRTLVGGEVKVVIGEESHKEMLQDLSLIVSRYGIPDEVGGVIGVIGPTRMDYQRAIAAVRYLSEMLSNLVAESYPGN